MGEPEKTKKILTISEVSQILRIPISTLYGLAQKGKIPAAKFGKHWRFLEEDIMNYFKPVAP